MKLLLGTLMAVSLTGTSFHNVQIDSTSPLAEFAILWEIKNNGSIPPSTRVLLRRVRLEKPLLENLMARVCAGPALEYPVKVVMLDFVMVTEEASRPPPVDGLNVCKNSTPVA